jgi:hypothetical protein
VKFFAASQGLKTAESQVKEAGDNSSSSIVPIVTRVKAKNDALAYSTSTLAAVIGAIAILIGLLAYRAANRGRPPHLHCGPSPQAMKAGPPFNP